MTDDRSAPVGKRAPATTGHAPAGNPAAARPTAGTHPALRPGVDDEPPVDEDDRPRPRISGVHPTASVASGAIGSSTAWSDSWAVQGLFWIALIALLKAAKAVMAPVLVAVVLTFILAPWVRRLRRLGIPEMAGAGILVAGLLAGTVLLGSALAAPAAQWMERAPQLINDVMTRIDRWRESVPLWGRPAAPAVSGVDRSGPPGTTAPTAPPASDTIRETIASESVALTGAFLGGTLSFVVSAAASILLLYFLLASEHWLVLRTVEALPGRRSRALLLAGARSAQRDISRFVGALAMLNLGVGVLATLAYAAIGLPNPLLWGTLSGVLNFIPYVGPVVIVGLLLLVGVASFDPVWLMLAPTVAFLVIHAIEANLVAPILVGHRVSLSPVSVFLSVMLTGWMWGITGALLAVPLLVGLRAGLKRTRKWRLLNAYLDGGGGRESPPLDVLLQHSRRRNSS